jgi:hypothetical protein
MRPAICHADLLRAFAKLDPQGDDEKRVIAAMLGFDWEPPATDGPQPVDRHDSGPDDDEPAPPIKPWKPEPQPRRPPPPSRDNPAGEIRILPARPAAPPQLDWPEDARALKAGVLGRAHAPTPLFRPQWTRAILGASLSARRPIGEPDLARAVELISRGEALVVLPRLPILTLAHGVQALIDVGESMQPFWQDRTVLRRDLKRIVGEGGLELLQCAGSPRRARREDDSEWFDYETRFPAQLGACVLIVSDFGLNAGRARGASSYTWSMLARRLARRGHRVVGFVPYPPARWPADLARAVDLVSWDRGTTVGRISFARQRWVR